MRVRVHARQPSRAEREMARLGVVSDKELIREKVRESIADESPISTLLEEPTSQVQRGSPKETKICERVGSRRDDADGSRDIDAVRLRRQARARYPIKSAQGASRSETWWHAWRDEERSVKAPATQHPENIAEVPVARR